MRRFVRSAEPAFLAARWEEWGLEWEQRRHANAGAQFHWDQVERESVNHKLLPLLKAQTQDHCSFCDNFPVSPPSIDTIEHFRPKAHFPREAYCWANLYFCCMYCQQKSDEFDEAALQPDAPDFEFERYFRWDHTRGTIEVNELATAEDQARGEATIQLYRLNEDHPSLRLRALRTRARGSDEPLDDFPYRGFIA